MFVDFLYGRQNAISNEHFTDVFVCNNNDDCEDVKLGSCSSLKLHMFLGLNDEYLNLVL